MFGRTRRIRESSMTFDQIRQKVGEAARHEMAQTGTRDGIYYAPLPAVTDARSAALTPEEASEFVASLQPLLGLPDGEVRRIVDGYTAQYNTVLP